MLLVDGLAAWTFAPDWTDGVLERLTWSTQILTSRTAAEQRRSLRIAPRRAFEAQCIVHGRERSLLDMAVGAWGSKDWALPIWPDVQWLGPIAADADTIACETAGVDFQMDGLAMLRGETAFDFELVDVLWVDADSITIGRTNPRAWPAGVRLYPVRRARLSQQPEQRRKTESLVVLDVAFELAEPADWEDEAPWSTYRDVPVFELRPNEAEDISVNWERLTSVLDNDTGLPAYTDTAGAGFRAQQYYWLLSGREQRAAWRRFMYSLRGRQVASWVPTYGDDLRLVATAADTTMDVQNIGYADFGVDRPGRRDIMIELLDGSTIYRRITGAVALDGETERLELEEALDAPVAPADVRCICFLPLCRQATDEIEIHHITDAAGVAEAQTVWRVVRDDLELST